MKRVLIALLLATVTFAQTKSAPRPTPKPAAAANSALPTEATVNSFMRQMFGYDPTLQWEVGPITMSEYGLPQADVKVAGQQGQQTLRLYITPDGKHAVNGEMIPFGADPFATARAQLAAANGPARGPADAPVTIVEFSDLQCPHCKSAQPIVDKLLASNPNARLVFEHFPLQGHDWARVAASWADCIGRSNNDAFWKFVQGVYDAQNEITAANANEKFASIAEAGGADSARAMTCAQTPETRARVDAALKLGEQVGVTGTPTLFINGRKIANVAGAPFETLDAITKFAASSK
ncbi:MAG TPA: DsbA family protein [Terriglobales bacterium]|nr:DsbA family protein [Terriglobales bacterium]